ncbi:double-strand break repair protein AddB [Yoonia sp. 2307UL14-13]|uniref:double-strand break repair protein AddB n=1 Tax=Yoonia sp. 2307UL14-13 TaxID=3126506 RepID=UPI0030A7FEAC
MFEPKDGPRVFGLPPGADYAPALVDGIITRIAGQPPEILARTEIYVNTARMQRRVRAVFDAGPARLLPRVRLVTDLARDPVATHIPPPVSPLRRRLEISQFVAKLLEREPDLAPRAALYDLSDSLATLMDEMQGEGVSPDVIAGLDVTDQSGHWDRALRFLNIIARYFGDDVEPDQEARQRAVVLAKANAWAENPPRHPVIVAGSTGSRGATALFMQAVAGLPQGAVVLPGFDFDLPSAVWHAMEDEDHPQFRFRRLMALMGFDSGDVMPWADAAPVAPARNRLISLSLRPAPVTSQWLDEGPDLGDLVDATADMTLVEAASPRAEAETIALRMRQAVDDGITVALISPDRMLTRQVTAALDRWGITPDDSAGVPLALSPPGRLLRHVASLIDAPLTGEALLTVLKHPLCHSGGEDRGPHLRHTRELELYLRRKGAAFPDADLLRVWAEKEEGRERWVNWVVATFFGNEQSGDRSLAEHLQAHLALAERIGARPGGHESGGLWDAAAGREARRICDGLTEHADAGGVLSPHDYAALFGAVLADGTVRDRDKGHPQVLIWGTLEARVQGADLTILGGMNDGVWPEAAPPDPWLNRKMRAEAGLLLPERRIGLSAHDYQQAIAGQKVWITRSKRSADAETVPSRWVNRLTNLLSGLPAQRGPEALAAMRERGARWEAMAAGLARPVAPVSSAQRPSPCPPTGARPTQLSVTQIKTLIRDPFAIYARKVLRLDPLDPLVPHADAPLRGIIVHAVLEQFIKEGHDPTDRAAFMRIVRERFTADCPWPAIRAQWIARMEAIADPFLTAEAARQAKAPVRRVELKGEIDVVPTGVTLTCKADRIDLTPGDTALIYDYKSGGVPSGPQQENFDKQLLLEAAMVVRGGFPDLGPRSVDGAAFLGINKEMKVSEAPLQKQPPDEVWARLIELFRIWQRVDRGYTARLAPFMTDYASPYDHLSRYGEWETSDRAVPQVLR